MRSISFVPLAALKKRHSKPFMEAAGIEPAQDSPGSALPHFVARSFRPVGGKHNA